MLCPLPDDLLFKTGSSQEVLSPNIDPAQVFRSLHPKVRRNQSLFHPPSVPVTSTFPGISASTVSSLSVSRQIQASEGQCWPLWVLNSPPPWNLSLVGIVHYFMHWAAHCRRWGDQDSLRGKWIRISCKGLSYLQILRDPLWGGPLTYTVLGENHCYHWKVSLRWERGPCEQLRGRGKAASYSLSRML